MNGRAYDYNLGRFLSVDPFIQAPGNSQSMNPYSYIMNNPLSGTDPSGYIAECDGGDFACQWDHSIGKIFGLPRSHITAQYNGMKTAQTKSNSSDNKPAASKGSTKDNDSVCQNEANCLTVIGSSYAMSHAIPLDPGARALSGQWLSDVLSRLRDASAFLRSNPHMIIIPAIIPTQLGDATCGGIGGCGNSVFSQGNEGHKSNDSNENDGNNDSVSGSTNEDDDSRYKQPPDKIEGFQDLRPTRRKTPVKGGGGKRKRWKDSKGRIYEWDSQHGTLEVYDKSGKRHLGEYDPKTGRQLKPGNKKRWVEK